MEHGTTSPDIDRLLLAFYECLTDPSQLDTLMAMLTSWLDEEGESVVAPTLDRHADKALRLLGQISEVAPDPAEDVSDLEVLRMGHAADVKDHFAGKLELEEVNKLENWLSPQDQTSSLLLCQYVEGAPELLILSRLSHGPGFEVKRTGPSFTHVVSQFLAESFELTHSELSLVRELLLGGTLREISDRLGKSWETTRSQIKSLTNKLGVNSQADVLRMVNQAAILMPQVAGSRGPSAGVVRKIRRSDGRTVAYEVDGNRSDRTLVYLHGMLQGRHWPEKAKKEALERGWQIVRISRAGRGPSSVNPKENAELLQDHVDDLLAVMAHEGIERFSISGSADGFAVGYATALQHPDKVDMVVGLEAVPPILSRKVVAGFSGKLKTFGLASLYAPKTVKYMFGLAMRQLERMEDRYSGVHPLLGVELRDVEDEEGIQAEEANFQDIIAHKSEGVWRDATFANIDWAYAPPMSNIRPRATLIHCGNSLNKSPGAFDDFANRINAPIIRLPSYFPYISGTLSAILDALESR